jgi:hypothetical protein
MVVAVRSARGSQPSPDFLESFNPVRERRAFLDFVREVSDEQRAGLDVSIWHPRPVHGEQETVSVVRGLVRRARSRGPFAMSSSGRAAFGRE